MQETIESLLFGNSRSIMGIIPNVVISEKHVDEVVITDHPVEKGTDFSDHAYIKSPEVTIRFGWSDSSMLLNGLLTGSIFSGATSLQAQYEALLSIQQARQPMQVVTGKRVYDDMLIRILTVETDVDTENALVVEAVLRKIFIVSTQTVQLDADDQQSAQTYPVQDEGLKTPQPTGGTSILAGGSGMLGTVLGQ